MYKKWKLGSNNSMLFEENIYSLRMRIAAGATPFKKISKPYDF